MAVKRRTRRNSKGTSKSRHKRMSAALKKWVRSQLKKNPRKAKGRSVRLTNFTGTVRKNSNGTISIVGRKKK